MAIHLTGKVVVDTNVFIDHLRGLDGAEWVVQPIAGSVRFLSSIVAMELFLGATSVRRRRAVQRIWDAFPTERIIAPAPRLYPRAASVFRELLPPGSEPADRLALMNDILIALSAWRIGAAVITKNARDFSLIAARLVGLRVLDASG